MPDIPEIFQSQNSTLEIINTSEYLNTSRWAEFTAHLTQFSDGDITEIKDQLSNLLSSEANPQIRSILLTGTARCQIHAGNFIEGAGTLGHAYSLTNSHDKESRAFVLMEMCSFMAITAQYDLAIMLLDKIPLLTESKYLLALANYYWLVIKTRRGDFELIDDLLESANYFEEINEIATLSYHYKNIGNIYRKLNDFESAEKYYSNALELSDQGNYQHIKSAVLHDMGMLSFHKGLPEQGIETLKQAFDIAENHYTKSFALGNIGFIYKSISKVDVAIDYLKQSLDVSVNSGVYSIIPTIAFHLGGCYEIDNNLNLAMYFYQKAYQSAVELMKQRFPFTGDRERAIKKYVSFISEHPKCIPEQEDDLNLSFALDKTMQEIRGIFKYSALEVLLNEFGSVDQMISQMQISKRSFYSIRERTKINSPLAIPSYIKEFIKNNESLNWKELNRKFEDQMLTFLFKKYGGSKKVLSEKLDISYPHLVTMLASVGSNQKQNNQ